MIREKKSEDGEKTYVYQDPPNNVKEEYFHKLVSLFKDYAQTNKIEDANIEFDFKLINEINIRVDKRRDYYIIFHDETHLSEVREAALMAFWILKFKPFLITSEKAKDLNFNVNCGFAAYIILSAVREDIEREYHGKKELSINKDYVKKLQYALKYWDLSKEALMLIAETLCRCVKDKD